MPLNQTEIVKLGITLLGGGAVGAIITALATSHRNRIQPVRYQLKTVPVFAKAPKNSTLETIVTLRQNGLEHSFANLYLTELRVINAGNQNIREFAMGITVGENDRVVNISCDAPDRHHEASQISEATPADPKQAVDFKLIPFNRRDVYLFRILSICLTEQEPSPITLSSNEAVRFVRPMSLPEASIELASPAATEAIRFLLKRI